MEVLTLVDNVVYGEGLIGEHGSSFLIKVRDKKILFDTGQTSAFIANAGYLAEDLTDVDMVVLSHGHYDHCGGLEAFLEINKTAKIYFKPKAIFDKYSQREGALHAVGFKLKNPMSAYPNTFVPIENDLEVFEGIHLIATIHTYTHDLVDTARFFVKDDMNFVQDPFDDELFLWIEEGKNRALFTGCSHKGILNILKTAYENNQHDPIHYVFGGMHFSGSLLSHLDQYLMQFDRFGIEKIYVNHCTGIDGYMRLKMKFPQSVTYAFTGFHVEIG